MTSDLSADWSNPSVLICEGPEICFLLSRTDSFSSDRYEEGKCDHRLNNTVRAPGLAGPRASKGPGPHRTQGLTGPRALQGPGLTGPRTSQGPGPQRAPDLKGPRASQGPGPCRAPGLAGPRASQGPGPRRARASQGPGPRRAPDLTGARTLQWSDPVLDSKLQFEKLFEVCFKCGVINN